MPPVADLSFAPPEPHTSIVVTVTYTHTKYVRSFSALAPRSSTAKESQAVRGEKNGKRLAFQKRGETDAARSAHHARDNSIQHVDPRTIGAVRRHISRCSSSTTGTTSSTLSTYEPSTRSSYPRPSPPSFLYPQAIVPHQQHHYLNTMEADRSPLRDRAFMDRSFDLPDMPVSLQAIIYTCMLLGFGLAILVWLINFPPRTWRSCEEGKRKARTAVWWKRLLPVWRQNSGKGTKQKPVDKPSKYARVPSASASSSEGSTPAAHSGGSSELATPEGTGSAIEMQYMSSIPSIRQRKGPRLQGAVELPVPASPGVAPWRLSNQKAEQYARSSAAGKDLAPSIQANDSQPPTSPENPFLPTPAVRPRSEIEYLSAHSAFFSNSPTPTRQLSPSPSPVSSHFSFEDVDALEAQTELPSHRRVKSDVSLIASKNVKKRWSNASWLDVVDGAVNKAVEGLARWTEDAPGEEGLLLPLGGKGNKLD